MIKKEYNNVLDFLEDASFKNWVAQKNATDINYWEYWIANNPDKKELVNKAKDLALGVTFNKVIVDKDKVASIIKKYDYKGKKGLGMMFVVEGMHKEAKKASMWVVFIDMDTKKMLLAKQLEGKASGFGFRNYWAKTFYNVLKEVEEDFNKWSKGK